MRFRRLTALAAGCVVLCAAALSADDAKLLFSVSFDNWDTLAEVAGGNPRSTTFTQSLSLRQPQGAYSRAGMRVEPGEELSYDLKGNIDSRRGTISCWVKPYRWDDKNLARRITFVAVYFKDYNGGIAIARMEDQFLKFGTYLDSYTKGGLANARIGDWGKEDRWHRIDATWDTIDTHEMRLYLDGKLEHKIIMTDQFPQSTAGKISLVPLNDWLGCPFNNTTEQTLIDEVQVWDRPLSGAAIAAAYNKALGIVPADYRPPLVTVPSIPDPCSADGKPAEPAWKQAALVPVRLLTDTIGLPVVPGDSLALWAGTDGLALGVVSGTQPPGACRAFFRPAGGKPVAILIAPAGTAAEQNSGAAVPSGASGNFREVVIPWKVFGTDRPAPGTAWQFAFLAERGTDSEKNAGWSLMPKSAAGDGSFGTLVFGATRDTVRLDDASDWGAGRMDIRVQAPGAETPLNAKIEVLSGTETVWRGAPALTASHPFTVEQFLPEIPLGRFSIAVTNADGRTLFSYGLPVASAPPAEVEFVPLVKENRILFQVTPRNIPDAWKRQAEAGTLALACGFTPPGAGKPLERTVRLEPRTTEISFPVPPGWPAGAYSLALQIRPADGSAPLRYEKRIEKPATPWLGSSIGLDEATVPFPFEPLKRAGNTVACWGRSYRFDGAFPAAVGNQGSEMLAGPIRMRLATDAGTAELGPGTVRWTHGSPSKAVFEGAGTGLPKGFSFTYGVSVEFDGLVLTHLTITPPAGGGRVSSLILEIPLKREYAQYLRNPKMFVEGPDLTIVKQWDGAAPFSSTFKPYLWVGNLKAGFDWFCESEKNWHYPEGGKPIEVLPGANATIIRCSIITQPAEVKKALTYTFGFQATPVKPLRPDWRALRPTAGPLAGEPYANATTVGYDFSFEYISWFIPQAWPRDQFQERAAGFANLDVKLDVLNHLGMKAFPYTSGVIIADNNPVWDFFVTAWQAKAGPVSRGSTGGGYTTRRDGKKFAMTAADPASWSPFLAWMADRMLADPRYAPGIRGIYVDNTTPLWQKNPFNGSGYEDDAFGGSGYSYSILGLRDLALRLVRVIQARKGTDGLLWLHAHNDFIAPIHGLGDYFFPGEQYGYHVMPTSDGRVKTFFYMDDRPLEMYRAEMNAAPTGVPQILLHLLPNIEKKAPVDHVYPISLVRAPTESIIAVCALHDLLCPLGSLNTESIQEWFSIVDRTGLARATFRPYWEKNGFSVSDPEAQVSAYRCPDGALVAVVVNFSGTDKNIALTFDPAAIGPTGALIRAFDERRKWGIAAGGGQCSVPVQAKNYAVVRFTAGS